MPLNVRAGASRRSEREAREKARILDALTHTDWDVTRPAARAGLSGATTYRRLRRYGLSPDESETRASGSANDV